MTYPPIFSLRTVSLDGSRTTRIPLGDAGYASYVEPDITAAGTLVASRVQMKSDIFRYPIDGKPIDNVLKATNITRQTGQVQVPSVSPDGKEVAYLSDSGGHSNLWVARVDGRHPPRKITDEQDPQISIGIPHWSPRGDVIVYIRGRVGSLTEEWVVNPDGTGHKLVHTGRAAAWSDNGEWLYYLDGPPNDPKEPPCIYKIRVDGGEPIRLRCDAVNMTVTSDEKTGYFSPTTGTYGRGLEGQSRR